MPHRPLPVQQDIFTSTRNNLVAYEVKELFYDDRDELLSEGPKLSYYERRW